MIIQEIFSILLLFNKFHFVHTIFYMKLNKQKLTFLKQFKNLYMIINKYKSSNNMMKFGHLYKKIKINLQIYKYKFNKNFINLYIRN